MPVKEVLNVENLTHIRYFLSVYDLGSFSKAAKYCNVSQPTISKSIRSLEQSCNLVLFNRDTRSLRPTESAHQLYPKCLEVYFSMKSLSKTIEVIHGGDYGEIKIGFGKLIGSLGSILISKVVSKYQNIKVSVIEADTSTLYRDLMQGELDFIICHESDPVFEGGVDKIICNSFSSVRVSAVASPKANFLRNGDNLIMYPWVFPDFKVLPSVKNNFYNDYYKKIIANGCVIYKLDNIDARLKLVLTGKAATVTANALANKYVKTGQLKKLPVDIDDVNLSVIRLSNKPLSKKAVKILKAMDKYLSVLNNKEY